VQPVANTALEDLFNRVSPGTLYAKMTESRKPKDKLKDADEPEYYL
jgi:hypothetical protein